MTKNQSFAFGTVLLTIANVISRGLGLGFRIVVASLAGASVIGVFQMVYPIYFILIVLVTGGIPVAVAKLVAAQKNPLVIRALIRKALVITSFLSIILFSLLLFNHEFITSKVLIDKRTQMPLFVIIVSIPFVALSSVFRGYLQGKRLMANIAMLQIFEQTVRVAISLFLLRIYRDYSIEVIASCLALGVVIAEICSSITTFICYKLAMKKDLLFTSTRSVTSVAYTAKAILALAVPISLSRLIISLNQAINSSLIPHKLVLSGLSVSEATVAYGELTGMAFALFFAPSMFIMSLAANLIPAISSAQAQHNNEEVARLAILAYKAVILLGIPISATLIIYGRSICVLIFNNESAGVLLSILGVSSVFAYTLQVSSSILQGLGKVLYASLSTLLVTALSITMIAILTPSWGIKGTALAFSCSFIIGGLVQIILVSSFYNIIPALITTLGRAIVALLPVLALYSQLKASSLFALANTVIVTLGVYLLVLLLLGERINSSATHI